MTQTPVDVSAERRSPVQQEAGWWESPGPGYNRDTTLYFSADTD